MKPGRVLNAILFLAFVILLALNWIVRSEPAEPNREFLPEMVRTARSNAFASNPNFPDGKTLQAPEPGTISRGALPLHYQATPQDALRAGEELVNPYPANDAHAVQRGQFVYQTFCQPCHGVSGRGDGVVVSRGFPAPPSLLAEHTLNMKDGQMFHVLAYGQGNMPSYAAQVSPEDRWQVILYLRSMQKQAARPTPGGKQ